MEWKGGEGGSYRKPEPGGKVQAAPSINSGKQWHCVDRIQKLAFCACQFTEAEGDQNFQSRIYLAIVLEKKDSVDI